MFDKIVESCQYLLKHFPEAQEAREYLNSRLAPESRELFRFGYFPGIKYLPALIDMVGEDILREAKLLHSKQMEDSLYPRTMHFCHFEEHPLIMPYRDNQGKIIALVGRSLLSDAEREEHKVHKYKNTSKFKKGNVLFGLYENKQHILDQNCVYIVEGQFDVIKAVEKGFKNIVGLGTANMTSYQFSVISRYTDNIYLLLDNDEPGKKGRKLIVDKFGNFANIRDFYLLDSFKDIDEYFTKSGEDSVSFVVRV